MIAKMKNANAPRRETGGVNMASLENGYVRRLTVLDGKLCGQIPPAHDSEEGAERVSHNGADSDNRDGLERVS
jgi:hypothetical protein